MIRKSKETSEIFNAYVEHEDYLLKHDNLPYVIKTQLQIELNVLKWVLGYD